MSPTVLERILQSTREELARRKRLVSPEALEQQALDPARPRSAGRGFQAALGGSAIAVIAEFKRRSPSAGTLREPADLQEVIGDYERGGASALSVLTEGPNFGGSLADLSAARASSELPILRKDFIVDRYQLLEALLAGADAVLLILAALGDAELRSLHDAARELGLDVLCEVHDRAELERALELGAGLIGINNRDLRDFTVDLDRTTQLIEAIPDDARVVSESGIRTAGDLDRLRRQGVDAVLVGELLMRAAQPAQVLRGLLSDDPPGDSAASGTERRGASSF